MGHPGRMRPYLTPLRFTKSIGMVALPLKKTTRLYRQLIACSFIRVAGLDLLKLKKTSMGFKIPKKRP
jgi:hypothetical protein